MQITSKMMEQALVIAMKTGRLIKFMDVNTGEIHFTQPINKPLSNEEIFQALADNMIDETRKEMKDGQA